MKKFLLISLYAFSINAMQTALNQEKALRNALLTQKLQTRINEEKSKTPVNKIRKIKRTTLADLNREKMLRKQLFSQLQQGNQTKSKYRTIRRKPLAKRL